MTGVQTCALPIPPSPCRWRRTISCPVSGAFPAKPTKFSWLRKGLETYFTGLIEIFWSKKRILEVYLNVIEMGQGVYGAEAASQYYFKKSASSLSKKQAALIIAILPNPRQWDARNPSVYVNRRANAIVRYLNHYQIPE